MKAAILYKANTPLEVVDAEQQGPQAGEARVRVMATGVCHSDWHVINGDWTLPLPMVLGHEAAGIVEEVGPGVSTVRRGDHIIFSFRPQCGRCFYCASGRSILCVGYVTRCAQVEAGASVVVIGCGGVGLNVVQGARLAGARMIIACELLENKLAFAREFGATHTLNAKEGDVAECVRKLTDGRGADYAFDAIGSEATTLQILDAIRPGGTAVIVGMAPMAARAPITPYTMALQEKTLRGTLYGSVRPTVDFPQLVQLYLDGRLKLDQLISRTYTLEEINQGFELLRTGQVARGVVVFA